MTFKTFSDDFSHFSRLFRHLKHFNKQNFCEKLKSSESASWHGESFLKTDGNFRENLAFSTHTNRGSCACGGGHEWGAGTEIDRKIVLEIVYKNCIQHVVHSTLFVHFLSLSRKYQMQLCHIWTANVIETKPESSKHSINRHLRFFVPLPWHSIFFIRQMMFHTG